MRPHLSVGRNALSAVALAKRFLPTALTLATALLLLSCGGGGGGDKTPTAPPAPVMVLTTVTVALSATTVQVGQTATANATGADQNGASISTGTVTWSSSSPTVATITSGGAITAVAPGQTNITATAGSKSGQITLTVIPVPVASVVVTPAVPAAMNLGGTQQLAASTLDASGAVLLSRVVSWTTSDSTKARVSTTGLVTAFAAGTATVTATSEGKSGTVTVTILQPPVAAVSLSPATAAVAVGGTQVFTATARDANGNVLSGRTFTYTTSSLAIATGTYVGNLLTTTGVSTGIATLTATSEGKSGTATLTVGTIPVSSVTVTPATASVAVGATVVLTATARDANGNVLSGRTFSWFSSNLGVATGTFVGNVLTATGAASGVATITATSEGKSGSSVVTVTSTASQCSSANALQLTVGQMVALTAAQKASLCLGGSTSAEYVLIPFSTSATAASSVQVDVAGTNTSAITVPVLLSERSVGSLFTRREQPLSAERQRLAVEGERAFRQRERYESAPLFARWRGLRQYPAISDVTSLASLTSTPTVGQVLSLNSNGSSSCTNPRMVSARIVSVSQRAIVLVETTAPAGGHTDAELATFGTFFDSFTYPLNVLNFGAPTDIDSNGRVAIFFTTGVNRETTDPTQGVVGGFFTSRDLYSQSQCAGSNVGEMFYMPVPDPSSTINGSYTDRAYLRNSANAVIAHEFQHLINYGRRLYVNGASVEEEPWLNEGLSHIAEELLYYQQTGNSPRSNIAGNVLVSSQAQYDAFFAYADGNFGRLNSYMRAPSTNSPYSQGDALETRGAIWQLLRYAADRLGGTERNIWYALANATTAGQANFNAVIGNIITLTRDWAIAQFTDDAGFSVPSNYTNPSWNFRSIIPIYSTPFGFPLATIPLTSGVPRTITLVGGGAAYIRFRVAGSVYATVAATSSGQPVPSSVDFILVRTQ